ncbi:MAG: FAD:protein FMN transferase [Acidimicrobiales bacterium]|nr:FAD:protein FMN transferase [Acidimicrobiales bacterium]
MITVTTSAVLDIGPAADEAPTTARTLRIMGCDAELVALGEGAVAHDALDAGSAVLVDLEQRWSRFRPDSELSRLNDAGGLPVVVAADTFALLVSAVEAWHLTAGLFDPTVLPSLLAVGYDRSFEELRGARLPARTAHPATPAPGCAGLELDPATCTVRLPAGIRLDLGGIGKGRAADLAAQVMVDAGADGALAALGGDVAGRGTPPDGIAWQVGVADPLTVERDHTRVAFAEGAVTTSGNNRRHWLVGDDRVHHLIDPRTGRPAGSDLLAVTVLAAEAMWAEILAKSAFVAGLVDGVALLVASGASGLLLGADGTEVRTLGFERFELQEEGPR